MRLPEWIKIRHKHSELHGLKSLLRDYGLSTVCEEARCPNKSECFSKPTATFMILGSCCTRNCGFCSVESAAPLPPDKDEPLKVALAAKEMGLKYVVVTSVTRDDLEDGGAQHFAKTVTAIKKHLPYAKVEVLTPDFKGDFSALKTVLDSKPDVFNHNVETVPRLYPAVRPQADYPRSLRLLRQAKEISPTVNTKSGLMLGLGEDYDEVLDVMTDLREADCDFLTIGQYLRPSRENLPVKEYVHPEVFERLREAALGMGFKFVASSPLVRSSMNAEEMYGVANVSV
jgi:lipoic acid synthetase